MTREPLSPLDRNAASAPRLEPLSYTHMPHLPYLPSAGVEEGGQTYGDVTTVGYAPKRHLRAAANRLFPYVSAVPLEQYPTPKALHELFPWRKQFVPMGETTRSHGRNNLFPCWEQVVTLIASNAWQHVRDSQPESYRLSEPIKQAESRDQPSADVRHEVL